MFGLTALDAALSVKPFDIFKREITLKASYINPYTQGRALNLINARALDVRSMVAAVAPLEELKEILSSPEKRALGKYIIRP